MALGVVAALVDVAGLVLGRLVVEWWEEVSTAVFGLVRV